MFEGLSMPTPADFSSVLLTIAFMVSIKFGVRCYKKLTGVSTLPPAQEKLFNSIMKQLRESVNWQHSSNAVYIPVTYSPKSVAFKLAVDFKKEIIAVDGSNMNSFLSRTQRKEIVAEAKKVVERQIAARKEANLASVIDAFKFI